MFVEEDSGFQMVIKWLFIFIKKKYRVISPKSNRHNHKNMGKIRASFPKCPYIRAYPYKYGRLGHTAHSRTYSYKSLLIQILTLSLKVLNKTDNRWLAGAERGGHVGHV